MESQPSNMREKVSIKIREMLTSILRARNEDLKIELNSKYCIEKISF